MNFKNFFFPADIAIRVESVSEIASGENLFLTDNDLDTIVCIEEGGEVSYKFIEIILIYFQSSQ